MSAPVRRVLVIGIGGIGGPAAMALATEPIDALALCDADVVSLENLPRQVLFADEDVGRRKVDAARERLGAIRPGCPLETIPEPWREGDTALLSRFDVVIDGTDRLETKLALHRAALEARVALAIGAALGTEGHALLVAPGGMPCYRCYFRDDPPGGGGGTCATDGVWPPLPGLVGGLLSRLAMAYLLGEADRWAGRLCVVDALSSRFRERRVVPDPTCPECGA
jgi:molybdopterin/thiamine biosynthesis adenylyltransferase